jgi:hypothetical protein
VRAGASLAATSPMLRIDGVTRILDGLGARYALIGAHAMAARGYPRFTVDVDFLTTDARVLDPATWQSLERAGALVDPRRGEHDDPLGGVVHIQIGHDTDVDVILARWKWEARLIDRAEPLTVAGVEVRVPRTADLVLLKLAAGGYLDLHDAAALLETGPRQDIVREVESHLDEVTPDIRPLWRDLLASTGE